MKKEQSISNQAGFSLMEVILASAVFALIVTGIVGAVIYSQQNVILASQRSQAVFLAEEGVEAVRNMRDQDFANLSDGTYGLSTSTNQWQLSGASDTSGIYTRQINISSIDSSRKLVSSNVTWQQNAQRQGSVVIDAYLNYWSIFTVGDWSAPIEEGSVNIPGNQDGWKIKIAGNYAYVVRAGGTPDFAIFDLADPVNPVMSGSLTLAGRPENLFITGSYAYVASRTNTQELQIIDISDPSNPSLAGVYNAPGNANARDIFVQDSIAYLVRASSSRDEFLAIDVSLPASPTLLGSTNLAESAYELIIIDSYAYVASAHNSQELQVIDVSSASNPQKIGDLNLSGNANALTIAGFDQIIVIGTTGGDVYTVDVTTPSSPGIFGTYDAGASVNDLSLGNLNKYIFIAGNDNAQEFQAIDISDPMNIVLIGVSDVADDLNGIAYYQSEDFAYGIGDTNGAELTIFGPQ